MFPKLLQAEVIECDSENRIVLGKQSSFSQIEKSWREFSLRQIARASEQNQHARAGCSAERGLWLALNGNGCHTVLLAKPAHFTSDAELR